MTWFDFGVLIVLALSVVMSLFRGLVREVVSLASWILAFAAAMFFGDQIARMMPSSFGPLISVALGFLAVFAVALLVGWLAGMALSSAVRAAGLTAADRALGVVFGILRGLVIVLAVVLLAGMTALPRESFWRDAALSGPFETAVLALRPVLPKGLAERVKYR